MQSDNAQYEALCSAMPMFQARLACFLFYLS